MLNTADGPRTAQELGALAGLHPSTVRFHLELLRQAGLVTRDTMTSTAMGRPPIGYTPTRVPSSDSSYERLAGLLAANLSDDAEERAVRAEQAGAAWAAEVIPVQTPPLAAPHATARLSSVFADIGFAPEISALGDEHHIWLRACPFRGAAREQPEICSVHRGLLLAGLERLGATGSATLQPFVEPETCLAVVGADTERHREDDLS